MIIAKGREIKEYSEIISIDQQITELEFTPEQSMSKQLFVRAFNAQTGQRLGNVLLKLRKSNSKISSEGLTKENGEFMYIIDANCPHYLEVERKGFIPYFLEFNNTKGNENVSILKVPLMPVEKLKAKKISNPEDQQEATEITPGLIRAVLITDVDDSNGVITLEAYACVVNPENGEDTEIIISGSENQEFEGDNLIAKYSDFEDHGKFISLETFATPDTSKWFRLVVNITSANLTNPEEFVLDQNFKNTLQDHNAKVLIFNDKKLVSIAYVPNYINNALRWDIGFINPTLGKFLKINTCSDLNLQRKTHMRFYMNLFKYLNDEGSEFNLKSRLGFDSEYCILKNDDHVLADSKEFIKAVRRLPINWISENIKNDEKLEERKYELEDFFQVLADGLKNIFGEVSLKQVIKSFEPHLGVHQPSPQKLHRTISKTSRRIYF